ncbi:MAG: FG-GAP-like repeat-containing protein [Phycisphaerales bacterium]
MAIVSAIDGFLHTFRGLGDGTFSAGALIDSSLSKPVRGQLRGSERRRCAELIVSQFGTNRLRIYNNNGAGIFSSRPEIELPGITVGIDAGDVDGDGDNDIVLAGVSTDEVYVLRTGRNDSIGTPVAYSTGDEPYALKLADLDSDGDLDLAVLNRGFDPATGSKVRVMLNNGNGSYAPAGLYPVGFRPAGLRVADLDGDGDIDIVTSSESDKAMSTLLNNGDATFTPEVRTHFLLDPEASRVTSIAMAALTRSRRT